MKTNKELYTRLANGEIHTIPAGTYVDENGMITDVSFIDNTPHEPEHYNIIISKEFLKP